MLRGWSDPLPVSLESYHFQVVTENEGLAAIHRELLRGMFGLSWVRSRTDIVESSPTDESRFLLLHVVLHTTPVLADSF